MILVRRRFLQPLIFLYAGVILILFPHFSPSEFARISAEFGRTFGLLGLIVSFYGIALLFYQRTSAELALVRRSRDLMAKKGVMELDLVPVTDLATFIRRLSESSGIRICINLQHITRNTIRFFDDYLDRTHGRVQFIIADAAKDDAASADNVHLKILIEMLGRPDGRVELRFTNRFVTSSFILTKYQLFMFTPYDKEGGLIVLVAANRVSEVLEEHRVLFEDFWAATKEISQ